MEATKENWKRVNKILSERNKLHSLIESKMLETFNLESKLDKQFFESVEKSIKIFEQIKGEN